MLIKLSNGSWMDPKAVTAIVAIPILSPGDTNLGRLELHLSNSVIYWPTIGDAQEIADDLAGFINMNDTSAIIEIIRRRLNDHEPGAKAGDLCCWAVCDELNYILREIEELKLNQENERSPSLP